MDTLDRTISVSTLIMDFVSNRSGILDGKEAADLETIRTKLTALRDGRATARGRLGALRNERRDALAKLYSRLAATKACVQSLASLNGDKATLRKLSADAGTMRSVISVASLYQKALGNAGEEPYTRKLLDELNACIKAYSDVDAAVKGQWAVLKGFENAFRKDYKGLSNKVRCTRAVVELRLEEAEQAKFKGMLRTVSRRSASHASETAVTTATEGVTPTATTAAA